jgi:hypothetical protein
VAAISAHPAGSSPAPSVAAALAFSTKKPVVAPGQRSSGARRRGEAAGIHSPARRPEWVKRRYRASLRKALILFLCIFLSTPS